MAAGELRADDLPGKLKQLDSFFRKCARPPDIASEVSRALGIPERCRGGRHLDDRASAEVTKSVDHLVAEGGLQSHSGVKHLRLWSNHTVLVSDAGSF